MNEPKYIIVHHTADGSAGPQLNKVNEYHKYREFPKSSRGFFVGYHYFIEKDGAVIQAREDTDEGAHCKGYNFVSIGIGLAGNFDFEMPTAKQIYALGSLIATLCEKYKIKLEDIVPHRTFANTSCYGTRLSGSWARAVYKDYFLGAIGRLLIKIKELLELLKSHD